MRAIRVPADGEPVTFDRLRELNADVPPAELVKAFENLPEQSRREAWADYALKVALNAWNADAGEAESPGGEDGSGSGA